MTASIPEAARTGFGAGADAYDRARPSYPADAVAWVLDRVPADGTVLDLAAGTGIFTSLLTPHRRVIAVEPVESMRAKIEGAASVMDGAAESIPLDDASVDAVTVAQAFHWFRYDEALAEIARVLRPGGRLVLLWNRRDESVPWVARMSETIKWRDRQISEYDRTDWPAVIGASGLYGPVEHRTFSWAHMVDRPLLADRVRSVSYIAAMPEDERESLVAEVLGLVDGFDEPFPLPYNTLVWCTTRS